MLRSGHLTHSDANTKDLLAIDLSSERVRLAKWLLDGVRQGQPLGALLGYRFERRLQDARLGQFIPYFREVAPLVAKKLAQTTDQEANQSVESIAANNVVDGLALHSKWKSLVEKLKVMFLSPGTNPLQVFFGQLTKKPSPAELQQAQAALQAELNLLDDAVDAVSDALLAESVYHAVQEIPCARRARLTPSRVAKRHRRNSKSCVHLARVWRSRIGWLLCLVARLVCRPNGHPRPYHIGQMPSPT